MSAIELSFTRDWPEWLIDAFSSALTILAACLAGYLPRVFVDDWLARLAAPAGARRGEPRP